MSAINFRYRLFVLSLDETRITVHQFDDLTTAKNFGETTMQNQWSRSICGMYRGRDEQRWVLHSQICWNISDVLDIMWHNVPIHFKDHIAP